MKEITQSELISFKEHLRKKYRSNTVRSYVGAVRSFIKRGRTIDQSIIHESAIGVAPTINDHMEKAYITKEEFKKILDACGNNEYGLRAKLLFMIMYNCGLRTGELIGIEVKDFLEDGVLTPVFETKKSKGRNRMQCIAPQTFQVLQNYLTNRSESSPFLFPNYHKPHEHISQRAMYNLIKKIVTKAGIDKRITPYTFRRTCITNLAKGGMSLSEIAIDKGNSPKTILRNYLLKNKEWAMHRGSFIDMDF